jgi:ankyrin repeat protein
VRPEGALAQAASGGDAAALARLLDAHPALRDARVAPHGHTLLHLAARGGHLAAVELLLARGLDPNAREPGDRTYPMHWAAAGGHAAVVERLADAGGDVVGAGDDHELEVIGWATCWDGGDDAAHRAVVDALLARGARHHVFSAVALGLADEVRRLVTEDAGALERPMSRHEARQRPLHLAVRKDRPEMVALLLALGADPRAADDGGMTPAAYAADPAVGRAVLEALAGAGAADVAVRLALGDDAGAERALGEPWAAEGALHRAAKRGDARAVGWLLDRGADPNAFWGHWDAGLPAIHLAAAQGHEDVVRLLLARGADPTLRDTKHDGDAAGWAEHGRRPPAPNWREVVRILEAHRAGGGA